MINKSNAMRHLLSSTLVLGTMLLVSVRVDALPLSYAFSAERFEVVGNLPGNSVDEFDDGTLDNWPSRDPTLVESNGVVTFRSPGTWKAVQFDGLRILAELSYIGGASPFFVSDRDGNFTGTSTWVPTIPRLNQHYGMNIIYPIQLGEDEISIRIGNFEPAVADLFGIPAGLIVFFGKAIDAAELQVVLIQGVSIDEMDITDDMKENVVLRLMFDDSTDRFTGSFSLDGGSTFLSPFAPIDSLMRDPNGGDWFLGAESWEVQAVVPLPVTAWLFGSGLLVLLCSRNRWA